MKARILFLSDLHKRDADFSTINGYMLAGDLVQHDILEFVRRAGVTHLVSLGDWYDKGYRSINRCANDRNLDEELSAAVGGNFFICLGNHFFLERDNNPEMYLIQPSDLYRPTHPIYASKPVIQAPEYLQIGRVRISLFHYSKRDKQYKAHLDESVKFHIGVYHDDCVVPSYTLREAGVFGAKPSTNLEFLLDNVNLAIVGHIHKPMGAFKVQAGERQVTMMIPGSLANTSNSPSFHDFVELPMVEIADDDTVSCKLVRFSLHCEVLRIYKPKETQLKAILPEQAVVDIPTTVNVRDYLLSKGFEDRHITLVEEAAEKPVDPVTGLKILGIIGGKPND